MPDALDRAFRKLLGDPQARAELAERGSRRPPTWPNEQAAVASVLRHLYAELARVDPGVMRRDAAAAG